MINFKNHMFNVGLVNGIPVLYTYYRLNHNAFNEHLHLYDIQSLDDGMTPKYIAPFVRIHHWGSIISKVPLVNSEEFYLDIEESFIETDEHMYLKDYLETDIILKPDYLEMRM